MGLFKIIDERLPERGPPLKPATSATNTFAGVVQKTVPSQGNPNLHVPTPFEKVPGKPPKKHLNSAAYDSSATAVDEDTDDDGWEKTREDKRKEKLRKRNEKKNYKNIHKDSMSNYDKKKVKKPSPVTVCTGKALENKGAAPPGMAAPRNVFISRTDKTTTKELVEQCLKYFAEVDGIATCVTPEQYRQTAHSLSWRVEVPAAYLATCLKPESWAAGWAVRQFFFFKKKKTQDSAEKGPVSADNDVSNQRPSL